MKLLAITTSTPRGGVALIDDGELVALVEHEDGMRHAERLFGLCDEALATAGWSKTSLDAVACDTGPGSFSGVRIGVASAKGVALALGIPLVGVGSLEAMAAPAFAHAGDVARVAPVIDARRGECFLAVYARDGRTLLEPTVVPTAHATERILAHDAWACGAQARDLDGVRLVAPGGCELPSARWIGKLAAARAKLATTADLATLEPVYARGPDARLPAVAPDYRK